MPSPETTSAATAGVAAEVGSTRLFALCGCGLARGAELGIGTPLRPAIRIGQIIAEFVEDRQVVNHTGKCPACIPFIGRLVVALGRVVLACGFAGFDAAVDPIIARAP